VNGRSLRCRAKSGPEHKVSAAPAYCDQAAAASGSATTAIISTRMPGRASDVPPVARAGGESALTHASQTAFMP